MYREITPVDASKLTVMSECLVLGKFDQAERYVAGLSMNARDIGLALLCEGAPPPQSANSCPLDSQLIRDLHSADRSALRQLAQEYLEFAKKHLRGDWR